MTANSNPIDRSDQAHAELRQGPSGAILAISGVLNLDTAARARRGAQAALRASTLSALEVDASGIEVGDMSGMSVIYELAEGRLVPGLRAVVKGLRPEFQILLSALPTPAAIRGLEAPPARRSFVGELGARTISLLHDLREQLTFLGGILASFAAALRRPRTLRWPEVLVVLEKAGVNAVPIVSLISLLTGVIIAYEVAQPLAMF